MGLLVGWDVGILFGTCNSGCRIDECRPWPVTVVVAISRNLDRQVLVLRH